jgi:hypothetical protein
MENELTWALPDALDLIVEDCLKDVRTRQHHEVEFMVKSLKGDANFEAEWKAERAQNALYDHKAGNMLAKKKVAEDRLKGLTIPDRAKFTEEYQKHCQNRESKLQEQREDQESRRANAALSLVK